jgi:signal transduction histidine kinase
MAQNLHKEIVQEANPLLPALKVEDKVECHQQVAGILDQLDEDMQVSLLFDALLKSINNESRKLIVGELTRIGTPKAVELLGSIVTDDFDPEVWRQALEGLRTIGSERAIDLLLSVLRLDVWPNRDAAHALGDFKSEKVVDALIEATRNPFFPVDAAIFSLAQIGSDRAIEHLVAMMHDFLSDMGSLYAMLALVRLGTEKAIDGILEAWISPVSILKDRLYFHLRQYKPKHLISPLCQRLQNRTLSPDIRKGAAEMLGLIGTESEISLLESIWKDSDGEAEREVGWRALRAAEQISYEELKRKQERERALEETRAFIAHEFRHALTPLNAYVKMLDEALNQPGIDQDKLSSLTARIRKQTDAAFALVNQYLDYSRPLAPQFVHTDINDLLQQTLEEFKAELETRKIVVRSQFVENANAEVDKKMLAQVLRNVIANAIQAIDKDGNLVVVTKFGKNNVVMTIRDTGTGVRPEHLPQIFQIGFTTKSGVQGAGVGLALSRRIIEEAHNGSIAITNNTDGPGATVLITLPRKQMEITNGRHALAVADR